MRLTPGSSSNAECMTTVRPMSHLQFSRAILSHEFSCAAKLQVWHGRVTRVFNSCATLFANRALLYSVQLCWQNAECWLVSCHRFFCFASVRCTYSSFCLIYFHLFNLFNLEMEWSDVNMLQLIELYEKRPYLGQFMRQSRSVQLDSRSACNFIARLCCTLARQNCARKLQVWHRSKRSKCMRLKYWWQPQCCYRFTSKCRYARWEVECILYVSIDILNLILWK